MCRLQAYQNSGKPSASPERDSIAQTRTEMLITSGIVALAVLALGWLTFQKLRKRQ